MADVALRAAFYLRLPTIGPIPIPQTIERWTVPRSNFIFKKSQENFERITIRRHIEIWDGHPENIEILLGFLRKHCYHGVGIKADVWDNAKLGKTELTLQLIQCLILLPRDKHLNGFFRRSSERRNREGGLGTAGSTRKAE